MSKCCHNITFWFISSYLRDSLLLPKIIYHTGKYLKITFIMSPIPFFRPYILLCWRNSLPPLPERSQTQYAVIHPLYQRWHE